MKDCWYSEIGILLLLKVEILKCILTLLFADLKLKYRGTIPSAKLNSLVYELHFV